MGTRCRIGVVNPDGTITSIYVHNDGYPEGPHGVGYKLREHYGTKEKIAALIALGDLSELGAETGAKHDFEGRAFSLWCTAYHRDRDDPVEECSAYTAANLDEFKAAALNCGAEYAYLFEANEWREVAL